MSMDSQPFKVFVLSVDIEKLFFQQVFSGRMNRYSKMNLQKDIITFTFSCVLDSSDYIFIDKRSGMIMVADILGQDVSTLQQLQFNQYLVVVRALL